MSKHTSFKVGGPARFFTKVESFDDLKNAFRFAQDKNCPYFILGKGSNLLVSDNGYNGIIIQLGQFFSEIKEKEDSIIQAGGATALARLARFSIEKNYSGMHKLAGIPGSLGGAIFMNAGAYGQEISQTCISVDSMDVNGNIKTRTVSDCKFGYRHSVFQELSQSLCSNEVIISASFQFKRANAIGKSITDLKAEMQECMDKRKSSQPLTMPNAGSTFKRLEKGADSSPEQLAPGFYIEQAGLKGHRIGGAKVSSVHANFIVNTGNATAKDIFNLIYFVQTNVSNKLNIKLQREIILLGEF